MRREFRAGNAWITRRYCRTDEPHHQQQRSGTREGVAMAVYKRGRVWWYRFTWDGTAIRESTKQTNKRVAEQIEAAHKTSLAKGEVGIRQKKRTPTVAEFAAADFLPFCRSTFVAKPNT